MAISKTAFPKRVEMIDYIIVHHTGSDAPDKNIITYLTNSELCYHYVITKDGVVHQMVDDDRVAYHAGESSWGKKGLKSIKHYTDSGEDLYLSGMNPHSIGVSLHSGGESFTSKQKASAFNLISKLCLKHDIEGCNVLRHSDITQFDQAKRNDKVVLPHRDDKSVKKLCRKWDVGCSFWKWSSLSWAGYQSRIDKEVKKLNS